MKFASVFVTLCFTFFSSWSQQFASSTHTPSIRISSVETLHLTDTIEQKIRTHAHGRNGLIVGAAVFTTGASMIALATRNGLNDEQRRTLLYPGFVLSIYGGITTAICGAIFLGSSIGHAKTGTYTVYAERDKIGIAYNF